MLTIERSGLQINGGNVWTTLKLFDSFRADTEVFLIIRTIKRIIN